MMGGRVAMPRARTKGIVLLALLFLGAAALGAYAHWVLWHPMDGVVIYLAIVAALLVAGIMALIPRARRAALVPLAIGLGLALGQGVGPSRQQLESANGTMTITLERPRTIEGTGSVSCETVPSGADLQLGGSARMQIRDPDPLIPPDVDPREFVWVSITVGDRWRDGPIARSDDVDLWIAVGSVRADEPEVAYVASDASALQVEWTNEGGRASFDRLVPDTSAGEPAGQPVDLAGMISWTCTEPPLAPEALAIVEEACAETQYIGCHDDLLLAMREAPGSLVAVCEHADGNGQIVPLERVEDAESWCSADGEISPSRVVTVLLLP